MKMWQITKISHSCNVIRDISNEILLKPKYLAGQKYGMEL